MSGDELYRFLHISKCNVEIHKAIPTLEPPESNCEKWKRYLTDKWLDLPDTLTSRVVAVLIKIDPGKVCSLIRTKTFIGAIVCDVWHCTKESLFNYSSTHRQSKASVC